MSERKRRNRGAREEVKASKPSNYWAQYRSWVGGLDRSQKTKYRFFQVITVIAMVIIMGALLIGMWIRVPEIPGNLGGKGDTSLGDFDFDDADTPDVATSGRREGVYTFLLVGRDTGGGGLTDTMMLGTFDTEKKTMDVISLPRDTMVNVKSNSKRLNAVFNNNKGKDKATQMENGMGALKAQVGKLTGITPDFYIVVEWNAIKELVDAIDGVTFDVPYNMDYDDPYQDLYIHQAKGLRDLTGEDAMQVIRWRKNNDGSSLAVGDTGRMQIQQDFLKAVAKKVLRPATLLKAPTLAQIFIDNVNTDLTIGNLLAFAQLAAGMDTETGLNFVTVPYTGVSYRSASMVVPLQDQLLELLNDGLNPYVQDITAKDLQLVYQKSNGSFGVTTGALVDEKMGTAKSSSKPDKSTQSDQSDVTTPSEGDGTGSTGPIGEGTDGETGDGETTPPDEQTGDGDTSSSGEQTGDGTGEMIPPDGPDDGEPGVNIPLDGPDEPADGQTIPLEDGPISQDIIKPLG